MQALQGGDRKTNARIVRNIVEGHPGPQRQAVLLNAAAALMVAGKVTDLEEGMKMAGEAIDSGKTRHTLQAMVSFSKDQVIPC